MPPYSPQFGIMASASHLNPPRSSPDPQASNAPITASQGSSQGSMLRRSRPSQLHTTLQANGTLSWIPASAISASSVASSSQHGSPIMSPENAVLTTSSSIQPSPEPFARGRDVEQFPPTPFALGDPLIQRKPSSNSMNPSVTTNSGSLAEALQNQSNNGQSLIRRLSSKLTNRARRQSSVAPTSRDGSIGPAIIRRRSDSTNTAPPTEPVFFTDSDEEYVITDERDEFNLLGLIDGSVREVSSTSNPGSVAGSASPVDPPAGPVIPLALIKGTYVRKISKKRKYKRIFLVLDSEAAKITWDKSRPSKSIYIDDIKEIRIGSDTRQYRLDYDVPVSEESRFFSVLYAVADKSKSKVMHLIAEDEETFANWVTALDAISKHRQDLMTSLMSFNDKAIRAYWNTEMTKQSGHARCFDEEEIDFPGVERVCQNLHIHIAQKELQIKFAIADTTRTGRLNFAEFQIFVREMKRREDIRALYRSIAHDAANGITWPEFASFLRDTQCEEVDSDLQNWEAKFARLARRPKPKDGDTRGAESEALRMTEQALAAYITSTFNLPLAREPVEYTLDRPMNEYFISSSHNTYLLGRQIADLSSVEGYITALVKGCRSIEIDCWDGPDEEPSVQHGFAMTNAISFREVINVVNKYAFVTSHFPLWVSLEVHCNTIQQNKLADIMIEHFGPRLILTRLDPSSDKLPTPSELKDRILVKVKAATAEEPRTGRVPSANGRRRGNSLTSPYTKPMPLDSPPVPSPALSQSPLLSPRDPSRRRVGKRYNTITEGEVQDTVSSSTSDCESGNERASNKKKTSKIVPALGDLGVYCTGVKFDGFDALECKMPYHILSFMEGTFRSNTKSKEHKDALSRHNMRYMMRVYPQFSRISSHNFNPLMYWRKGVQMAALNWQTFDHGMQLNQAMFEGSTDQSGYVLKPHSMREIRVLPNGRPEEAIGKLERKNVTFSIDIISAQQLMRPASLPANRSVDPYVEVEVFHANDKRDKHDSSVGISTPTDSPLKDTTRIVRENGFNPIFDKKMKFNVTTKYPELIFIRWSVKLSANGETPSDRVAPMATFTAKLTNLKQGYRTLPLLDPNGDRYLFSTLFCRLDVGPFTDVYVNPGDGAEPVGKFKILGNKVLNRNRSSNTTSKISSEKSLEKSSFDSGYSDKSQQPMIRSV
ncbi:phosphatidylinositol-specific phospholipase C [Xylariales sp. AK1849]|nr:phosphatidylinositol-specific phospholipase C [Xylariales sp. AK1849]